jgi:integrase
MQKHHYLGDGIEVRQNKTKELLAIRVGPQLKEALDSRPFPDAPTLIVQHTGKPFPQETAFSNVLKAEIRRLGVDDDLSFHGLRYAAAARLAADAQCSIDVLLAILGHRTYQMAVKYATKRHNSATGASILNRKSADSGN